MANLCKGTLKVRGTKEAIEEFLKRGIAYFDTSEHTGLAYEVNDSECDRCRGIEVTKPKDAIMAVLGVYRNEIEFYKDWLYFSPSRVDPQNYIGYFQLGVAYAFDSEQLRAVSEKFNLDLRIHAFEKGIQFEQFIEIRNGEIIKDEVIEFKDRDWAWECVNPYMGG